MKYKVSMRGDRWKRFESLDAAKAYAEAIRLRTGNIVAIVAYKGRGQGQ